ncbi:serine protease [Kitasatospora sp. A2-31]|uniref:serine protease n=1 Tax=Kitasatospora sp. A2-31 TaxID=2916414 RepID=UPI001EE8999F|nr:serine protease [Kitasatospora sp. A2-31]MCG6493677.1 serine protease [Kitasatospora sp. A2-31]
MPGFLDGDEVAGDPGRYLLRIRALDGRLRGLGFVADPQGTVLTAHECVAGLDRIVLHTPGGQTRVLGPDSVLPLPAHGLALLRTDAVGGLPVPPLPIAPEGVTGPGREVVLPVPAGEDGRLVAVRCGVLGATGAVYTAGPPAADGCPGPGPFHLLGGVLLLGVPGGAGGAAAVPAGAPVLDARGGAVVGVAAPALRAPEQAGTLTVAPATGGGPAQDGPELAAALARNAAGVPAYGPALNLAGVLRLAAARSAAASAGPGRVAALAADRIDRPDGLVGDEPSAVVTVLVGAPGSGRSTELAALAARRAGGDRPLPTLWLRGADLDAGDVSLAGAVRRALESAAADLATQPPPGPEAVAALCAAAGRPLLVLLDGPEEAPVPLDAAWLRAAGEWLAAAGGRLVTACGEEAWAALAPDGDDAAPQSAVHLAARTAAVDLAAPTAAGAAAAARRPALAVHRLGPLPADAADRVRRRYGLPPGWPAAPDARHPLAVRLAGELWAEGLHGEPPSRSELFAAHLDLRCLRVAQRLAADGRPRRGAHRRGVGRPAGPTHGRVRRLAAAVAGRVHEAARRMLGAEEGGLSRAAFEELFPVAGGWAAAVLAEGLFTPAGPGYRLAHGEFADWLQGLHLDLDGALRLLLGEAEDTRPAGADRAGEDGPGGGRGRRARAVPRYRVGPVAAALGQLAGAWGAAALDPWLHRLWRALDLRPPGSEPAWWAGRLLAAGLKVTPDLTEHRALLDQLAARIAEVAPAAGGFERLPADGLGRFDAAFWTGLGLPAARELELLRRLVTADGPGRPFLAAVAARLRADPAGAVPLLCGWFEDPRGLPGRPGTTVADLAHDLLYAHRALALDELTEALADAAHPRADALLTVLAAAEPSALCRAVDRWSHDRRPERHVAAAVHALRAAPYARGAAAELLRHTARTLLARDEEPGLHGAALALLVADRETRAAHLPAALAAYRRGADAFLTARTLAPALETDPEPVLAALADRLGRPGAPVAETLRVLADVRSPLGGRCGAELAARLLRVRPAAAGSVAVDYLGRRLAGGAALGPAARLELRLLLGSALAARAAAVRRTFAEVLAVPVADAHGNALRAELLDTVLATEGDPEVLAALVERSAEHCAAERPARARTVLARAAAGLPDADRLLVRCAGRSAAFALLLADWPDGWPVRPDGPRLERMRELVAAGWDPRDAAAQAGRAGGAERGAEAAERGAGAGREDAVEALGPLASGARHPAVRATRLPVPNQGQAHGTL